MLLSGFDPNKTNDQMDLFSEGGTPIHLAAIKGSLRVLALLLAHPNIHINSQQNPTRSTPLHLACRWGHTQVVQMLLNHGADRQLQDTDHLTPSQIAESFSEECLSLFPS
uniref:Uncharacterized protein n=1 Tax=Arcella intermedia TaxID=1963864 RepID=A0A6B2LSE7_9EUKA